MDGSTIVQDIGGHVNVSVSVAIERRLRKLLGNACDAKERGSSRERTLVGSLRIRRPRRSSTENAMSAAGRVRGGRRNDLSCSLIRDFEGTVQECAGHCGIGLASVIFSD